MGKDGVGMTTEAGGLIRTRPQITDDDDPDSGDITW